MRVRDDRLDATQVTPGEGAEELGPERPGLAVADVIPRNSASTIGVDRHGDDHHHRDDMMVSATLP